MKVVKVVKVVELVEVVEVVEVLQFSPRLAAQHLGLLFHRRMVR